MSAEQRSKTPEGIILRPNESVLNRNQIHTLVQLNPLTNLLNPVAYEINFGKNEEKFHPNSFDSIQVVWVQVTPTRKELLIKDGNHRASVVDKKYDEIKGKYPDFQVVVRDITGDHMEDKPSDSPPKIAPIPEDLVINASATDAPPAITMRQYMAITVDAMKLHQEILPLRVAAVIMKRWKNIVGDELEKKFSGLAALTYLENREIESLTPEELKAYLNKQSVFFVGDTPRERIKLREGLITMKGVLKDHDVSAGSAASSAFVIMSIHRDEEGEQQGEGIGGRDAVKKQIAGILHIPVVRNKLEKAYGKGDTLKQAIASIANDIANTSIKSRDINSANKELRPIYASLVDPDLKLSDFKNVLSAKPDKREAVLEDGYTRVRTKRYTQIYKDRTQKKTLSSYEQDRIRTLARRPHANFGMEISEILTTDNLLEDTKNLVERLGVTEYLSEDEKNEVIERLNTQRNIVRHDSRFTNRYTLQKTVNEIREFFNQPPGSGGTIFRKEQAADTQTPRTGRPNLDRETTLEMKVQALQQRINRLNRDLEDAPQEQLRQIVNAMKKLSETLENQLRAINKEE